MAIVAMQGITPMLTSMDCRYDGVVFKETFTFFALRPDSKYEVRVRAKNEEGWSDAAKEFIFTTPK